jgi:hypothetical protein
MIRFMKKTAMLMALGAMAACSSIAAVEPGPFQVGKAYQFNVNQTWSAFPKNTRTKLQSLTIDGIALNSLTVGSSIEDGKPLLYSTDREKIIPLFRSDMSDSEVVEFIADSLRYGGAKDVETSNLRPESFGTLNGIAFDLTSSTASGLNLSGMGKAAIEDGKLHLIIYSAPTEYYFGLHKEEAEKILASITLL